MHQENEQIDYINMNCNILQMGGGARAERDSKILFERGGGLIIVLNCVYILKDQCERCG